MTVCVIIMTMYNPWFRVPGNMQIVGASLSGKITWLYCLIHNTPVVIQSVGLYQIAMIGSNHEYELTPTTLTGKLGAAAALEGAAPMALLGNLLVSVACKKDKGRCKSVRMDLKTVSANTMTSIRRCQQKEGLGPICSEMFRVNTFGNFLFSFIQEKINVTNLFRVSTYNNWLKWFWPSFNYRIPEFNPWTQQNHAHRNSKP